MVVCVLRQDTNEEGNNTVAAEQSLYAAPFSCTAGYLARAVVNNVLQGSATTLSTYISTNQQEHCLVS